MSSLPEEIEVDIFLRLPLQSILACKFVCKPWYKIISSSKFIKDHLNLATQNNNDHRFMLQTQEPSGKPWIWSVDFASLSFSGTSECLEAVPKNCPFQYVEEDSRIRILGSCNGLIALGIYTPTYGRVPPPDGICVWNPATREYKDIPLASFPSNVSGVYFKYKNDFNIDRYGILYGFGYDCNIENYKLVKIAHCQRSGYIKSEIYTLGSDTWKPIKHAGCCYSSLSTSPGMLLNGALHWEGVGVATKQKKSCRTIVSFNISNERHIHLPFPEESMPFPEDYVQCSHPYLGVLDDCLCILSPMDLCADVWVMLNYGVRESWTKQFTFTYNAPLDDPRLLRLRSLQNVEILLHKLRSSLPCDSNNGSIRYLRALLEGGFVYAESLVSLNSGNYVGRAKQIAVKRIEARTFMQALTSKKDT